MYTYTLSPTYSRVLRMRIFSVPAITSSCQNVHEPIGIEDMALYPLVV